MNEEIENQLHRYKTQIVLLIFTIVSVIISISVLKILIDIARGCKSYSKEQRNINTRARISAIIILLALVYFTFDSIEQYRKNKTDSNFHILVSTLLVLIAAVIRVINLFSPSNSITDSEELVF